MKILITGSSGFIGKHLVDFFKKNKVEVIPFDLINNQNLLDERALKKAFSKKPDYIVHLAAYGDVYKAAEDPTGAIVAGAAATMNLVKIASNYPIKKIVYASTWEVYGKPKHKLVDEKHGCHPFHPYSIAKYSGELAVASVINRIPWIILRLGSVYGPNMRPYAVIPLFINKALKKEPIVLQGGGKQTRQFVYIEDICRAFSKALQTKATNEIFNIVGDEVVSIKQIANKIKKHINLKVVNGSERVGDPINAVVSNKKAKNILKWKPLVSLDSGISGLISEIKSKR